MVKLDGILFDVATVVAIVFLFPFLRRKAGSLARNRGVRENTATFIEKDAFIILGGIGFIIILHLGGNWTPLTLGLVSVMFLILAYDTLTLFTDIDLPNPLNS